jgi:hypothetical protein
VDRVVSGLLFHETDSVATKVFSFFMFILFKETTVSTYSDILIWMLILNRDCTEEVSCS